MAISPTPENTDDNQSHQITPPSISMPKGGGAVKGIGEKFAANPVTGTGSMTVPIAASPGRSGFGPQLSLSYDSGSGNSPFGFGWSLSMPAITRKTDKGLPQYLDAEESDVFILSGAEDLVPVLQPDGIRFEDKTTIPGYTVHRYRPRIEGLFARIERWTDSDGDVHWRSISRDNILTLYGKDGNSRIYDPDDPNRIFSWLICETRDDKGNAIIYGYKSENGDGVDLTCANERNRGDPDDPRRTANRYIKHIRYGNRTPLLDDQGKRPPLPPTDQLDAAGWMFEVVFDYGEHDEAVPRPGDVGEWGYRSDPFSTYRSGFEVRTTRLCRRVLMFHHFETEQGVGNDCLVRSTDFTYSHKQDPNNARYPVYTFLHEVNQSGYKRDGDGYLKRSLPPVAFQYTRPALQDTVEEVDPVSLENLPIGVDGAAYHWTDLHGEGIPGILTEQAGEWYYKRNLSPVAEHPVEFAPLEAVAVKPNLEMAEGGQFMDLAGDGQPDLVMLNGPTPGLYEHDGKEGWQPFRPFTACLNRNMQDPNLKLVDLSGDGHADVLITEDNALTWHASLAEAGFGPEHRVANALDEEKGPRLVFADGTQSVYLADLSGDGLTDLVRLRNGEVCYWPNLGYGRFGAKVTMDHSPRFDHPDQFDQKRIRLADIDGTGTVDIIYLHRDGVRLYFNQSGNGWSEPTHLSTCPKVDDLVSIAATDLSGNGTACLVWSSPLPGDEGRPMRYVNLMGGQKPHLLVKTVNNLGAETRVHYAPSTKFYLQDKQAGKPWITRLPFPVHVVERVATYDHISRNRFVTRYAYHHGYFDGEEREFRGFGMVEQWDTEEMAALTGDGVLPEETNIDPASHVPPVLTRSWFHTGMYQGRNHVSDYFAGLLDEDDTGEYYREPGIDDDQARTLLLPDTILPHWLSAEEEREACRSLKGAMLRQEVFALDGSPKEEVPYTVTEQNFSIHCLQPHNGNRHAVFFTHARESIAYHYERNPADPRTTHTLTLEVDDFGNVLKQVAIGYGRRQTIRTVDENGVSHEIPNPDLEALSTNDQSKQTKTLITYTENRVTNSIEDVNEYPLDYRTPLPWETRTYELTGFIPEEGSRRFSFDEWARDDFALLASAMEIPYETPPNDDLKEKRLIEQVRTLYRRDDMTDSLPFGEVAALALPYESYNLAFTPGLVAEVYDGRVTDAMLEEDGRYVHIEDDTNWWIPSGRVLFSPNEGDSADQERDYARQHFFLPYRFRDPFEQTTTIFYDQDPHGNEYNLLITRSRDPLENEVNTDNDYRVLQPRLLTDPNGNRSEVAFDALGMTVATTVMGKKDEDIGDLLENFDPDPSIPDLQDFFNDPKAHAASLLGKATTRFVYDLDRYQRICQPPFAATLSRETHFSDPGGADSNIRIGFSYSDGFGRKIQQKIQAEPGPVAENGTDVNPRWVGSGWTIFNNKGKPVRQYEPFFDDSHEFRFGKEVGVSPILFYDPLERVITTLHPNHTYEKVVFGPWHQETWDKNDTVLQADPNNDPDVGNFFGRIDKNDYLPTWYERMMSATPREQDTAQKAAEHADTPAIAHFDTLGRPFLTIDNNGTDENDLPQKYETRVVLDIEGNQREVIDAKGRVVMHYDYYMAGPDENEEGAGNLIYQASMEAGERWMLNDVAGNPIRAWNSRNHELRYSYDELRRPTSMHVSGENENTLLDNLYERIEYGDWKDMTPVERAQNEQANRIGKPFEHYDTAGKVLFELYDFKGNLKKSTRWLAPNYKKMVDWRDANLNNLENESFTTETKYDALNRVIETKTPDGSISVPTYNEANLLNAVDVNLRGEQEDDQPNWTPFVTNIGYDAKGQRTLIEYGNGTSTVYEYDKNTFRLIHLITKRPAGHNGLGSHLFVNPTNIQDLHYTYDPVGNITNITDNALLTIHHANQEVAPVSDYIYDAIYRLISAQGREHISQTALNFNPPEGNYRDYHFEGLRAHPNDRQAVRNYTERYDYDESGNIKSVRHAATDGSWTRRYTYNEPSLLEAGKQNNRLTRTQVGNGHNFTESYEYTDEQDNDVHGCITAINSMQMHWDFKDQLQQVDLGGGGKAYYVYDAAGQRVRKVILGQNGFIKKERIYLGGFESYREYGNAEVSPTLERETLHIMDGQQRIALVETRTQGSEPDVPEKLIRCQLNNHLGSASLELDEGAQIVSYEEYFPYGSTSYQAGRSQIEISMKRYRFTGKERDEESGFNYHGARYYAPWLGRWTSCDPLGRKDDNNLYVYVHNNIVNKIDPNGKQPKSEPQEMIFPAALVMVLRKSERHNKKLNLDFPSMKYEPFKPDPDEKKQDPCKSWLHCLRGEGLMELSYSKELILRLNNFTSLPHELRKNVYQDIIENDFLTNSKYLSNVKGAESGQSGSSIFEPSAIGDIYSFITKDPVKKIGEAVFKCFKLRKEYEASLSNLEDFAKKDKFGAAFIGIPLLLGLNYSGEDLLPEIFSEFHTIETNQIGKLSFGFGSTYLPLGSIEDYFRLTFSMKFEQINNLSLGLTFSIAPFDEASINSEYFQNIFPIAGGLTLKLDF